MFFKDIPVKFQSDLFWILLYMKYTTKIYGLLKYTEEMTESQIPDQMHKTKQIGNDFSSP